MIFSNIENARVGNRFLVWLTKIYKNVALHTDDFRERDWALNQSGKLEKKPLDQILKLRLEITFNQTAVYMLLKWWII